MMMIPCLQDHAWMSDEFWADVKSATDYAASFNGETEKSEIESRVLENILFFSRPMGTA